MPDNFTQKLRDGATQFGERVTPGSVHLVRARGDQRRRRKAAGTAALVIAIVAGGGGAAYALGQPGRPAGSPNPPVTTNTPSPSATPRHTAAPPAKTPGTGAAGTPSPPGGTTTLHVGHIVMHAPSTWRVTYSDGRGDYTVSTGSCAADGLNGAMGGSPCPSFSVISGVGPMHGPAPVTDTYQPGQPYITGDGASGCPDKPDDAGGQSWLRGYPAKPVYSGYAPVTTSKTADYNVWQIPCRPEHSGTPGLYFQQADWYLPVSRILIVDEYSIPGLPQVLATATWQ